MPNKEIILIVDDEAGTREVLRRILSPLYEVHTADTGEAALRFIHDNYVDLVTLDLGMPGRSGFSILKKIKNFRPDTEVILITGFDNLENAQDALRLGATDFIPKPFKSGEIVPAVARALGRRSNNLQQTLDGVNQGEKKP